ncbi:hypothetical protein ASE03_23955 [Kitasatospora sp. Root187]|nr:hypothetical protein ASC99_27830 [Kitasatospora sp. Root107]KRB71617.1 hypothetical protein ASE03_23955 [Kitasatospora sp. Root187]
MLHLITDPRGRGAQNLARDLHAELLRRGAPSVLRALQPHADAPPEHDAPVLGPSRHHPATLRALRAAARQADVVVAHGSSTLQACAVGLLGTGVPFVYVNIGDPRHWTASLSRRLRVGAFLHRAAAVSAISDGARTVLLERFRLPARKVRTIPNGRAADAYRPAAGPAEREAERRGAREELGLPPQGPVVAWIGALAPEKRLDLALAAIDRLPGVHLAVAGDGPLGGSFPLTDRVHFLGRLADPGVLYRAADALLLTSDSEGVPGVLIEAALAELPAVATDVGWVGDVVLDGRTGALVRPGDPAALAEALGRVLAGDRAALGAAARAHALARFDLAVVTDSWQHLLSQVTPAR